MNYLHVNDSSVVLAVDAWLEISRYKLFSPLLRVHGRFMKHGKFDSEKYQALDPMDRCFDNAFITAKKYGLKYCEGVMFFQTEIGMFPLAHGWCLDASGRVVDPTCSKYQGVLNVQYLGLPIKMEYVEEWYLRVGYHGCLDGDKHGRPIGVHHEDPEYWLSK